MDWSNVKAIITGGASGLGQAVAQRLMQDGAQLCILDNNIALARAFIDSCQVIKKRSLLAFACDICSEKSVKNAIKKAQEQMGGINLVVNCAGIVVGKKMLSSHKPLTMDDFKQVLEVNLIGTYRVCQQSTNFMQANIPSSTYHERGVIINTASIAAYEGQVGQIAYSASKGAIISMTLPMARELAQYGIRVMTIAPGLFDTQLMAGLSAEVKEQLAEHILFPKQLGEPKEFAQLVKAIVENPFLNGSVIRLDGGLRMPEK